jgi:hypothetical protein
MAKLKRSCNNDIKTNLKETGGEGMDWIDLAQDGDRLTNPSEHANKPLDSINDWDLLKQISDYQLLKESVPCSL